MAVHECGVLMQMVMPGVRAWQLSFSSYSALRRPMAIKSNVSSEKLALVKTEERMVLLCMFSFTQNDEFYPNTLAGLAQQLKQTLFEAVISVQVLIRLIQIIFPNTSKLTELALLQVMYHHSILLSDTNKVRKGDPVEAEAIHSAFPSNRTNTIFVGSVKSAIGHTESTAGLAGLIKTSLALQHATIPPNLLFRRKNPKIEAMSGNLEVPVSALPWPKTANARRASVNKYVAAFSTPNCNPSH
jgi:hypothetical protein